MDLHHLIKQTWTSDTEYSLKFPSKTLLRYNSAETSTRMTTNGKHTQA